MTVIITLRSPELLESVSVDSRPRSIAWGDKFCHEQ